MYTLADPSSGESAPPGKVLNSKGALCRAKIPELNRIDKVVTEEVTEEGQMLRQTWCHLRAPPREEWKDSVTADSEEAKPVDGEEAAPEQLEEQE